MPQNHLQMAQDSQAIKQNSPKFSYWLFSKIEYILYMNICYKKIFIWSLSLILFAGVITSGQSNTFCLSEDSEVRTQIQSCCNDENTGCSTNSSKVGLEDCIDCIDIELDTPLLAKREKVNDSDRFIKTTILQKYINIINISSFDQRNSYFFKSKIRDNQKNYSENLSSVIFLC